MVLTTHIASLASLIGLHVQAHPSLAPFTERDLGKPALLPDFDSFTADPSRIPPAAQGTATRWAAGRYPTQCYDKAREVISDTDSRPKCELRNLEVYNVTYSDCTLAPRTWRICRCSNAEISLTNLVRRFGTVPPGVRSNVHQVIMMNGYGGGGGYAVGWSIFGGGDTSETFFSHEAMHNNDPGFSDGPNFSAAIAADTCVPDNYSNNNNVEDFAQVATYLHFDKNGRRISDYTGRNPTCMTNQLNAARNWLGDRLNIGPYACHLAAEDDGIVTAKKVDQDIIEQDPESSFGELLPHTPYERI